MIAARLINRIFKSDIKNKIISYSIILLFLNMIVISAISYFISSSTILDRISKENAEILNQSIDSVDFILKSVESSAIQAFDELDLSEQLHKVKDGNIADKIAVDKTIGSIIEKLLNLRNEIDYIYVIGDSAVKSKVQLIFSNESYARFQVINEKKFRSMLENQGDSFVWTYVVKEGVDVEAYKKVGLCRAILDSKNNNYMGFILIMLREGTFTDVYSRLSQQGRQVYLVDNENIVVSSSNMDSAGKHFFDKFASVEIGKTDIKEIDSSKYIVSCALSQYTGWKMYMVEPQEKVLSSIDTIKWWLGIALLTGASVFIVLSILLSNILTKPIKRLKRLALSVNNDENAIENFNHDVYSRNLIRRSIGRRINFRTKLFIMLFTIIIIPVMLLMAVTYYVSYGIINVKASEINRLYAKQTAIKLEYYLNSFEKSVYDLYAETKLNDIIRQQSMNKNDTNISKEDKDFSEDVLDRIIEKNREIAYIQLFDAKKRFIAGRGSSKQVIPQDLYDRVDRYDDTVNIWYGPYSNYYKQNVFTLGKKIKDMNDFVTTGYIFTSLKESDLEKIYGSYDNTQNTSFIIDDSGLIISHPNKNIINSKADPIFTSLIENFDQQTIIRDIQGTRKMISLDTIRNNGWIVVNISSMDVVAQNMKQMLIYYIAVLLLTGISIAFITFKVSKKIGKPLNELGTRVSKFAGGDLDFEDKQLETGDEIEQLYNSFNSMMTRIRSLIKEVYETKLKQNEAELNSKEAELTLLQAQINPHFLYNTLEIIRWKAMFLTNGENEVTEIVSTLSDFFRLSLSKGSRIVTLKDEIDHAANYITIMNYRYNNKIFVDWQVDESLLDCRVPKIILQPIIENAIYHGIKSKSDKGIIEVHACKKEDSIYIEVRDNGAGMSSERIEHLNAVLAGTESGEKSGYGLRNVNQRIKLVFGENYGLKINSILNCGTVVSICLPKIKGQ